MRSKRVKLHKAAEFVNRNTASTNPAQLHLDWYMK